MTRIFSLALALFLLFPFALSAVAESAPALPAPASATMTATPIYVGTAEGSLAIVAAEGTSPRGYLIAWGNADGPLDDYHFFPEVAATGERTVYYMPEGVVVPNEADRLLVYAVYGDGEVSAKCATAYLPVEYYTYDYGTPLSQFGVASDVHINEENHNNYNDHFKALLADLKATMPNADGLYINGDIADWGKEVEYQMFRQFIDEAALSFPVYANYGNHDSRDTTTPSLFKQYANTFEMDTMWYTLETEDANFIFFVSYATNRLHEYLYVGEENLTWLAGALETMTANGKKTFLMFHQPLANTVAGSEVAEGETSYVRTVRFGDDASADGDLLAVLLNYPDVMVFMSHTHFTLEAEKTLRPRDSYPYMVNTASTAYISRGDGVAYNEAQALYVEVYGDKVLIRGRDVLNGKWFPTAQFALDYGMAFAGAMSPAPVPPADTEPPADNTQASGGCGGSLMTATMPACLASLGVAVLMKKKRR